MTQPGKEKLFEISNKYIQGKKPHEKIRKLDIPVGILPKELADLCKMEEREVYITTWSLKHIYDKRFSYYQYFIKNLFGCISNPTAVFFNKGNRRGEYLLYKEVKERNIIIVLEKLKKRNFVVTSFPVNKKYLSKLKIVNQEGQRPLHRTVK